VRFYLTYTYISVHEIQRVAKTKKTYLQDLNRSAHGMFLRLQEIYYLVSFNISYRVCDTRFLLNIINALRGRRPRLN